MSSGSKFVVQNGVLHSKRGMLILSVLLGGIGGSVFLISTPWGIGVGYDSVFYLSAADNFINGLGLSRLDGYHNVIPLTHYPPLYPFILAAGSMLSGLDTVLVARLLSALLFALGVILVSWLVFHHTESLVLSLLSALLTLTSPILLDVHLMAMSEPLYLVLMLLFIISINAYLTQASWKFLLLSSGLTALAYLTRYVGVSIVVTGTIAILVSNKRKASQGLRDVFIYIIGSTLPTFFWYLRNWQLTGAMTNRAWGFHPPTRQQLYQGMVTISTWLLPVSVDPIWRLVVVSIIGFGLLAGLVLWSKRYKVNDRKSQRLIILLVLIMVIYGLMLIASLTFFDASTRLNDRILSPLYILTLVLSLVVIGNGFLTTQRPVYKSLIIITGLILVGVNVVRSQDLLFNMHSLGRGFTGSNWRNSETIAVVNDMSSDIILFSNEAFPIYFLTGKPTNWIPERVDVVKQKEREEYQTQMTAMRETLMQDNGALILFDTLAQRNVYAPISELTEDLILWKDTSDGAIYLGP